LTQAWSPIGGITAYRDGMPKRTFDDPTILAIAAKYGCTSIWLTAGTTSTHSFGEVVNREDRPGVIDGSR
jgi:hypothetical protein